MTQKFFCALVGLVFLLTVSAFSQDCDLTGYRLFIDPGHGGTDPGSRGPTGYLEKTATLSTGLLLRDYFEWLSATVGMSRTTDTSVALTTRATRANTFGAHRFISVHYNAFSNPAVDGTETFVVPNASARTRNLGQSVQDELVAYLGTINRGLKTANFTVLVRTSMSAALSESVFITNPDEEAALRDIGYRDWIAAAHAQGFCDHLAAYPGDDPGPLDPELSFQPLAVGDPSTGRRLDRVPVDLTQPLKLRTVDVIGDERFFLDPQFSPDGRFLVFAERGRNGLYLIDTSNARPEPQRIVANAAAGMRYAWSPDSRAIAYVTRNRQGFTAQWSDLTTGALHTAPATFPQPIVPIFDASGDLLLADPETSAVLHREGSVSQPTEPPTPSRVFVRDGNLWVARRGQAMPLTQGDMEHVDALASPDGSYVLAQASHPQGAFLFCIDSETGVSHNLSLLGVGREGSYNLSYEGTWSPDGQRVLVNVIKDDGYRVVGSDLYITGRTGRQWQRLNGGGAVKLHAVWSAQHQIAFDDGAGRIVLADLSN